MATNSAGNKFGRNDARRSYDLLASAVGVRSIFDKPIIREIETEILSIEDEHDGVNAGGIKAARIRELLRLRKSILDGEFSMNGYYARLLIDFNERLRQTLVGLEKEMVKAYDAVKSIAVPYDVEAVGKCFLDYEYSPLHPVQTERARRMWNILNGSIDSDYVSFYADGIDGFNNVFHGTEYDRAHLMDNLEKDGFNHNHGLESDYTKGMHIILPTHLLYHDMSFAIFDILWVQSFAVEVHVEYDYTH